VEIHQLQYAVEVAKQRSFTRAADEICVSQSTLSHQIGKLEDELGLKLFERRARSVHPTEAGEDFVRHAKTVLATLEIAAQNMQAYQGLLKGTLRIGVIASLARIDYAGMLTKFYQQHPGLMFEIVQTGTYVLLDKLTHGELDMAFLVLPSATEYEEIDFYPLAEDEYVLAVPYGHVFARKKVIDLAEAAGENFIFHPSSDRMYHTCIQACQAAGFKPNIVCQSNHSPTSVSLISAGMGIGFFPWEKIKNRQDQIVMVKLKEPVKKHIALAVAKQASPAPAVKAFANFVTQWVKELPNQPED